MVRFLGKIFSILPVKKPLFKNSDREKQLDSRKTVNKQKSPSGLKNQSASKNVSLCQWTSTIKSIGYLHVIKREKGAAKTPVTYSSCSMPKI